MQYLSIAIRCLIGAVFLASSASKVGRERFDTFVSSVRDMRLLSRRWARPVARCLITAEFAVWLLLAAPSSRIAIAGFSVAVGLLTMFVVGIELALRHGVRAPCQCFGTSTVPLGRRHVVRNMILIAVAALGVVVTMFGPGPMRLGGTVVAVPAGLALGALIAVLDDVIALFRPTNYYNDVKQEKHNARTDRSRGVDSDAQRNRPHPQHRRDQTIARTQPSTVQCGR